MTNFKSAKKSAASRDASSNASCSGVVKRMSGGTSFWRLALVLGRIAGAGFDGDGQSHLCNRLCKVALNVDG